MACNQELEANKAAIEIPQVATDILIRFQEIPWQIKMLSLFFKAETGCYAEDPT